MSIIFFELLFFPPIAATDSYYVKSQKILIPFEISYL